MKIIKYILLTLCLFANTAFATNISDEFKNASKCGVGDNGFVELWSWDICEQDFSFRVFYRLFPDVMDEHILPITNPKFLSGGNSATSVKELEKEHINVYRSYEYSLMNIFKNMFSLALFFGLILFIWHMFLGAIRSATEGEWLGSQFSLPQTLIKYGVILIGFLPLGGGLLVIHVIVFLLILFGIAFANLLYGTYINYMDIGSKDIDTNQSLSQDEQNFDPYNSEDYYSAEIVKGMLKMSMCKTVTEQFMLENNITQKSYKNWGNISKCSAETVSSEQVYNENISGSGFSKNGSFLNAIGAKAENFTKNSGDLYLTGGVYFGRNLQNDAQCDGVVGAYNYNCGSMTVSPPTLSNGKVLALMKDISFFDLYSNASKQINSINGSSPEDIKNIASSAWEKVKTAAIEKLNVGKSEQSLSPEDEIIVKNIAYYFHKLLLNDTVFGGMGYIKGENSFLDNTDNTGFLSKFSVLSDITGDIITNHCSSHQELYQKSKNLKDYLEDKPVKDQNFSAACLIITNTGDLYLMGKEAESSDGSGKNSAPVGTTGDGVGIDNSQAQQDLRDIVIDLSSKRKGIKSSLFQAVKGFDDKSISHQMRKLGWASAGSYVLRLIKNTEADSRIMTAFDQSIGVDVSKISPQMIGKTYQSQKDSANEDFDNPNFLDLEQTYKTVIAPFVSQRRDLRTVDVSAMSESIVNDLTLQKEKEEHLTTLLLETLMNPFGDFKRVIGSGVDGKMLTSESVRECVEDMSKCNISFNNPMSAISDFGNNLIKVSTTMIVATAVTSLIKYASLYFSNSKLKNQLDENGSISKVKDDVNNLGESVAGKVLGGTGKMVYNVADFFGVTAAFNAIYYILSMLINVFFVLLLLGIWFAYILPLVPFMTFLFAFIAWITMCLIALFVAPMWLAFNIQMTEKDKGMTDMMQSALNISLQILFRPALTIIALIIGWSLFTIVFAIISLTSMPFLASVLVSDGSFSISTLIDNVLVVAIYGGLLFISIKYVFTFINTLANQLFQIINVNSPMDEKSGFVERLTSTTMLSMLSKFKVMQDLGGVVEKNIAQKQMQNNNLLRDSENKKEIRRKFNDMSSGRDVQNRNEDDN